MVSAVSLSATATPDLRVSVRDVPAVGAPDPSAVRGRDAFTQGAAIAAPGAAGDQSGGRRFQGQGQGGNAASDGSSSLFSRIGNYLSQLLSQQEATQSASGTLGRQAIAAYQAASARTEEGRQSAADLLLPNLPPAMASGRRIDLTV